MCGVGLQEASGPLPMHSISPPTLHKLPTQCAIVHVCAPAAAADTAQQVIEPVRLFLSLQFTPDTRGPVFAAAVASQPKGYEAVKKMVTIVSRPAWLACCLAAELVSIQSEYGHVRDVAVP